MNPTVGQQLRQARQEGDISLEQVAHGTHIRLHYLQALEAGDFDRLPSRVQARGFLRAYASYLGMDPEPLLLSINGEEKSEDVVVEPAGEPKTDTIQEHSINQSKEIFAEIGSNLERQRELLGLSLEDVERHTHLRVRYLKALETGHLADLPSSVQGRGMLKNYAEFLGLDPEPVLLRFADALQTRLSERQPVRPEPVTRPHPGRSLSAFIKGFPGDFLLGGLLLLLLVGFVVWGAIRISALRSQADPLPTIPSIADELLTSTEALPTPTTTLDNTPETQTQPNVVVPAVTEAGAETAEPDIELTEESAPESGQSTLPPVDLSRLVNVSLAVSQRAWVRVTVDSSVEFEGRVLPGSAYTFSGDEEVVILTGNGAALQVNFNDQDLGTMGIYGEVVNRVFTPEGMVLPTPTITPTSTLEPTETPSLEATNTIQPTPQP